MNRNGGNNITGSYVYYDRDMMYIACGQMELTKGRLPERTDEIAALALAGGYVVI